MNFNTTTTIISIVIAFLGFTFGIYKHFANRKFSAIAYQLIQLLDFALPPQFFQTIHNMPFTLVIESVGNKQAQDIEIYIETETVIEYFQADRGAITKDRNIGTVQIPKLNPGEKVAITGQCIKQERVEDYIRRLEVSHSEAQVIDRSWLNNNLIEISLFGLPLLVYDVGRRKLRFRFR